MSLEYVVTLDETPFGITFFEGLDIPLVEAVAAKSSAATAVSKSARKVRVGDRLVGINGRDVSQFSTPHVLALLAEASWKLRRSQSGGDVGDGVLGGVALKFRAALNDENPDSASVSHSVDHTPDKNGQSSSRSDRDRSPVPSSLLEIGPTEAKRRASQVSVTSSQMERAVGAGSSTDERKRRSTNASSASGLGSVASLDVSEVGSLVSDTDNQLAELEAANRERMEQVAREKTRLEKLREERKREELAKEERKRAKRERVEAERRRAAQIAAEEAQIKQQLLDEQVRLERAAQMSENSSVASGATPNLNDSITPVPDADMTTEELIDRELARVGAQNGDEPRRKRSVSREREIVGPSADTKLPSVDDVALQRQLEREYAAEARKRKNDMSEIAARARAAAQEESRLSRGLHPPKSAKTADSPEDAAKAKQAAELRRLQRSVMKLEKYVLQLSMSGSGSNPGLAALVRPPVPAMIGDNASVSSTVDSQATTPVAQDRLPVRVVRGSVTESTGYDGSIPEGFMETGHYDPLDGMVFDDRQRKELERIARNPTPTLLEPAILPIPVADHSAYAGRVGSVSPGFTRAAQQAVMRTRSVSPARVNVSPARPRQVDLRSQSVIRREQVPASPARSGSVVRDFRSARVDTWNRDYIRSTRSRSVSVGRMPVAHVVPPPQPPQKTHNFLRRSSSGYQAPILSRSQQPPAKRISTTSVDKDALVRQATRRYGAVGAQAASALVEQQRRRSSVSQQMPLKSSSGPRSPSPSGWAAEGGGTDVDTIPVVSPASVDDRAPVHQRRPSHRLSSGSQKPFKPPSVRPPSRRQSEAMSTVTGKTGKSEYRSQSPAKPEAPAVTLRKIIRATRHAAEQSDNPSLRDVAIKVAEDAFAARNARLKAKKELSEQAKAVAKQREVAAEKSKESQKALIKKHLLKGAPKPEKGSKGSSRQKRREELESSDDDSEVDDGSDDNGSDDDGESRGHSSHGSGGSGRQSKNAAARDASSDESGSAATTSDEESEEEAVPVTPRSAKTSSTGKVSESPGHKSVESAKSAPKAAPVPIEVPKTTTPRSAKPSPAVTAPTPQVATQQPESSDNDEDDEYDEYDDEVEDVEEQGVDLPPSRLVDAWDDSKKSYDVVFYQTPFGLKFRPDQSVPVVEIVRPEGAGAACGRIAPGHTMISVNGKSLLGVSLPEAARLIGEAATKTKESNGKIPCVVRFLKTEVPTKVDPTKPPPAMPRTGGKKGGKDATDNTADAKKSCCFPRKAKPAKEEQQEEEETVSQPPRSPKRTAKI